MSRILQVLLPLWILLLAVPGHSARVICELEGVVPCTGNGEFALVLRLDSQGEEISFFGGSFVYAADEFEWVRTEISSQFQSQLDAGRGEAEARSLSGDEVGGIGFLAALTSNLFIPREINDGPIMRLYFRKAEGGTPDAPFEMESEGTINFVSTSGSTSTGPLVTDSTESVPCEGGSTTDPSLVYEASFAGGQMRGWTTVSLPGDYDVPTFQPTSRGLSLSPAGSAFAFGFYRSPVIEVEGGSTLEVQWTVRSSTDSELCPTIRMRVNETGLRHSTFLALDSSSAGISPSTESRTYRLTYHVPEISGAVELAFDLLSFNDEDDLFALIELEEVRVYRK